MNEQLKDLRKLLKLTQTDFGVKIGRTLNSIQKYESGSRKIDDTTLLLICKTFNVNPSWLKEGIGEMFSDSGFSEDENLSSAQMLVIHAVKKMDDGEAKLLLKYIEDNASRNKSSASESIRKKLG